MSFCAEQLARVEPVWARMLDHRFLRETRDGTIAHRTFATWMRQEEDLDALARQAGEAERARMAELFETTARYELAFWEMAATGEGWPGLEEKP